MLSFIEYYTLMYAAFSYLIQLISKWFKCSLSNFLSYNMIIAILISVPQVAFITLMKQNLT